MCSSKPFKIFGKNKYEIYFSLLFGCAAFVSVAKRPVGYFDLLFEATFLTFGFLCALNAMLDSKRMNSVERIFAATWFCLIGIWMVYSFFRGFTTTIFADR
jgi:hypothetical protein